MRSAMLKRRLELEIKNPFIPETMAKNTEKLTRLTPTFPKNILAAVAVASHSPVIWSQGFAIAVIIAIDE